MKTMKGNIYSNSKKKTHNEKERITLNCLKENIQKELEED